TATELQGELAALAGEKVVATPRWPKSPRRLSGELRRLAPTLRAIGIEVVHARKPGGRRDRTITLARLSESQGDRSSLSSRSSQAGQDPGLKGDGRGDEGTMADIRPPRKDPVRDGVRDRRDDRDTEPRPLSGPPF